MNLEELITSIYKNINATNSDTKITKNEIRIIYKAFIEIFKETLREESESLDFDTKKVKVNLPLIGKFNIVRQDSYLGKNPKSKETIKINSNNRIYFSPKKGIKKAVNK